MAVVGGDDARELGPASEHFREHAWATAHVEDRRVGLVQLAPGGAKLGQRHEVLRVGAGESKHGEGLAIALVVHESAESGLEPREAVVAC
jgi:hypothetical protein